MTDTITNPTHTVHNGENAKLRIILLTLLRQHIQSNFMTNVMRFHTYHAQQRQRNSNFVTNFIDPHRFSIVCISFNPTQAQNLAC